MSECGSHTYFVSSNHFLPFSIPCGFCYKPDVSYWVKGTEGNGPLAQGFMFIGLGVRLCLLSAVAGKIPGHHSRKRNTNLITVVVEISHLLPCPREPLQGASTAGGWQRLATPAVQKVTGEIHFSPAAPGILSWDLYDGWGWTVLAMRCLM